MGCPESRADKLISIVTQELITGKKGVLFRRFLYVPGVHPVTLATFHYL